MLRKLGTKAGDSEWSESDILSDHADGLGSDVQERGDVL